MTINQASKYTIIAIACTAIWFIVFDGKARWELRAVGCGIMFAFAWVALSHVESRGED